MLAEDLPWGRFGGPCRKQGAGRFPWPSCRPRRIPPWAAVIPAPHGEAGSPVPGLRNHGIHP